VLTNQLGRAFRRGSRRRHPEDATTDLAGLEAFPELTLMISLRHGRTFRALDDEGRPMLIITDGVSAVALDVGVSGLSYGTVVSARRLADALGDFASSLDGAWHAREEATAAQGRHRRNGRRLSPWGQGRNIQRVISRWAR
jgi:hypothetical protein